MRVAMMFDVPATCDDEAQQMCEFIQGLVATGAQCVREDDAIPQASKDAMTALYLVFGTAEIAIGPRRLAAIIGVLVETEGG